MKFKKFLPPLILGVLVLLTWEISCRQFNIQEFLLPTPLHIFSEIKDNFLSLSFHTGITLYEALIGFLIANVSAILFAILMVYFKNLDNAIMPFAIALKTTPIVAMAPLLLLWFGNGVSPKIAAAVLICFFPALVNSIKGFNALDEGEEDLFNVYGASNTQILFKLRIQRAAPYIFSALRISSSLAIVGAIVGEFVGADQGIGYIIMVASYHMETVKMFAALVMTAIAGVIFYGVISYYDKKYVFWMPSPSETIRLESPPRKIERRNK
jgi:NitT/TauT family transport system permease protein